MSGDYFEEKLKEMSEKLLMGIFHDAKQETPITADKLTEFCDCNDVERTFRKHRKEDIELDVRYWYPKALLFLALTVYATENYSVQGVWASSIRFVSAENNCRETSEKSDQPQDLRVV